MNPQSPRFEPHDVDRLIAKFGEKPSGNTRETLESKLLKEKERFERIKTSTHHRTRDDSRER